MEDPKLHPTQDIFTATFLRAENELLNPQSPVKDASWVCSPCCELRSRELHSSVMGNGEFLPVPRCSVSFVVHTRIPRGSQSLGLAGARPPSLSGCHLPAPRSSQNDEVSLQQGPGVRVLGAVRAALPSNLSASGGCRPGNLSMTELLGR